MYASRIAAVLCVIAVATSACDRESPCTEVAPVAGDTIRFAALGDTGTGQAGQRAVASALETHCAANGCDFIVLLGDNFYPDGVSSVDDPQWTTAFEEPYANLDGPFYVTLGNHDYGGDGAGNELDKGAHQIDYGRDHPKWFLPAPCYSQQRGPALLLALDTNAIAWNHKNAVVRQGEFASRTLANTTARWRIAFAHHPYRSNGQHGDAGRWDGVTWPPQASGKYVRDLVERDLCGRLDVYLSGHDHDRQILEGPPDCPTTFIVSGAGAKTRPLRGNHPAQFEADTLGFAWLEVSSTQIRVQMVNEAAEIEADLVIAE